MGRKSRTETHRFFCINCGQEGIPLPRRMGCAREKFHRKRLYCPNCQTVINMVECRNYDEIVEFKEMFAAGSFIEEAAESLKKIKGEKI